MFERTRITLQILMTLVSFFGFNEAVLALRYRNSVYLNSCSTCVVDYADENSTVLALGYGEGERLLDGWTDIDFHKPLQTLIEDMMNEINNGVDSFLPLSLDLDR